jgi:hypothetical protein
MRVFERSLSTIVLGAIAPVSLMLAGWWGSYGLLGDGPWIAWAALIGLAAGVALDLTVWRARLAGLYALSAPALTAVVAFYSVMIYGFFMGFVVANVLVGIGWGFVVGRRHAMQAVCAEQARSEARVAATAAATIMFALSCVTAWLALNEPTIASQMRGMFGLPFTPSTGALQTVALFGGLGLVAVEYVSTIATARWAAKIAPVHGQHLA